MHSTETPGMFGDAFKQDHSEERPQQSAEGSDEDEEAPLLFVDVNLGPNDQRRIVVYEGDDARALAE